MNCSSAVPPFPSCGGEGEGGLFPWSGLGNTSTCGARPVEDERARDAQPDNSINRGVQCNVRSLTDTITNRLLRFFSNPSGSELELLNDILPPPPLMRSGMLHAITQPGGGGYGAQYSGRVLGADEHADQIEWQTVDYDFLHVMDTVRSHGSVRAALKTRQKHMLSDGISVYFFGRPLIPLIQAALEPKLRIFFQEADNYREWTGFVLFVAQKRTATSYFGHPYAVDPMDFLVQTGSHILTRERFLRVLQPVLCSVNEGWFMPLEMKRFVRNGYSLKPEDQAKWRFAWLQRQDIKYDVCNWPLFNGRVDTALSTLLPEWVRMRIDEIIQVCTTKTNGNGTLSLERRSRPGLTSAMANRLSARTLATTADAQAVGTFNQVLHGPSGGGTRSTRAPRRAQQLLSGPLANPVPPLTDFSPQFVVDMRNDPAGVAQAFGLPEATVRYYSSGSRLAELVSLLHMTRNDPTMGKDVACLPTDCSLSALPHEVPPPHYQYHRDEFLESVAGVLHVPRILWRGSQLYTRSNQHSVVEQFRQNLMTLADELSYTIQMAAVNQWSRLKVSELSALCVSEMGSASSSAAGAAQTTPHGGAQPSTLQGGGVDTNLSSPLLALPQPRPAAVASVTPAPAAPAAVAEPLEVNATQKRKRKRTEEAIGQREVKAGKTPAGLVEEVVEDKEAGGWTLEDTPAAEDEKAGEAEEEAEEESEVVRLRRENKELRGALPNPVPPLNLPKVTDLVACPLLVDNNRFVPRTWSSGLSFIPLPASLATRTPLVTAMTHTLPRDNSSELLPESMVGIQVRLNFADREREREQKRAPRSTLQQQQQQTMGSTEAEPGERGGGEGDLHRLWEQVEQMNQVLQAALSRARSDSAPT